MIRLAVIFYSLLIAGATAATKDCSGTITKGGTAVLALGTGDAAVGFYLQNIDTNEALWFSVSGTAAGGSPGSFILAPSRGGAFSDRASFQTPTNFPASLPLTVNAATAGHKFSCFKW